MTTAFKHRWSFSLRTMFVVVTVLALWFGWHLKWTRQRDEFQAMLVARRLLIAEEKYDSWTQTAHRLPIWSPMHPQWVLWMLGKPTVAVVTLDYAAEPTDNDFSALLVQAESLFPEALVATSEHLRQP